MSLDDLKEPWLWVMVALIVAVWMLGSHFEKVAKRYEDESRD